MIKTDGDLVQEVLHGRREAFADLVQRHESSVRAVAMAILHDFHIAQDAVQDTFVNAYQNLAALRNLNAFGPWVLKIARCQALRLRKQKAREPSYEETMEIPNSSRDGKLDQRSQELLSIMTKLPEHEQRVILLKHFDFRSIQEIAALVGAPVGTITKQLSRAYARLRNRLEEMDQ
jgi:RNA polymerase sigma-70 factor (ECF subfamily)